MVRWKDVVNVLVCCIAVLAVTFGALWAYETTMEIRSMQSIITALQAAQRPLVTLQGKYVTVFAKEDEVILATAANK